MKDWSSDSNSTLFALIYRLPYSKKHPVQIHTFLDECGEFLTSLLQENSQTIITGDFNILWNLSEQTDTGRLNEISNTFNLIKEIEFPMHKASNILDWIIHKEELNCIHCLTKLEFLSDHCIIEWTMKKLPSISVKIEKQSRNLKNINIEQFKTDLKNKLEIMQGNVNIEEMYGNYINIITSIIENPAPTLRRKHNKETIQIMV